MSDSTQLVPAVDRAIRMLSSLRGADDGRRISDLARDLAIPKSSAFQIAATLVHHRILECDDETRRYRLGPGLLEIAADTAGITNLPALATPYLEELAEQTRTTALLGVPVGSGVVLAAKAESPERLGISAPVGHRLDPRAGVFGKLFAAALADNELDSWLQTELPAFTERSITDPESYRRELNRVRVRGYALDVEEYVDGVRAVGAPVRARQGRMVAGICLLGLSARFKRDRLTGAAERARDAARDLSRDLGFVEETTAGGNRA